MTDPLIRQTQAGPIKGYQDDLKNVWVWKSIPFAKPPVGELRWKAPQDRDPWSDIRLAVEECPWAIQLEIGPGWASLPNCVGSEDCLYLNIYRPQSSEENLPVYFWIHGGANLNGDADSSDMENLARQANLVVVVIQYRMSVLGYFTHPAIRADLDPSAASGNLGTLDQIKALEWVQTNIRNFGGDPHNVTIAGESAGGHNVMAMLISPLAKGLFHKAIMQSGGMVSQSVAQTDEVASQTVNQALIMEGLAADVDEATQRQSEMEAAELRTFLYELTGEELMIAHAGGPGETIVPLGNLIEDGYVIPGDLFSLIASGAYEKVPFMAGSNTHESGSINTLLPSLYEGMPNYYELLDVIAGTKTLDDVLPSDFDKLGWTCLRDCSSRFWRAIMVDELLKRMRLHQDDLYAYLFEWGDELVRPGFIGFIYGAAHALEIPFMHGNATDSTLLDPGNELLYAGMTSVNESGRRALCNAMVSYVAAFTRTGDPNGSNANLPHWQPWTNEAQNDKVLRLGASLEDAQISMDSEELSMEGVRTEVLSLEPAIQEHVTAVLDAVSPYWKAELEPIESLII
ncbi:MAG: carboxylesterase family protein [Chloroflexota bacterium]